jgi:hypothetical protein
MIFCLWNCMLSTKVSGWPKIWKLKNLSGNLTLYTVSTLSKVPKLSNIFVLC